MISILNKSIINLSQLEENAANIRAKLSKGVKLNAVVKADAYGHGAPNIANAIYGIVDSYSVALVEEGVTLRIGGIDKDILVLIEPFQADIARAVFYNLTLTVTSVKTIRLIAREASRQNTKIKAHIKYNTGMNRQGVDGLKKLDELIIAILAEKSLILEGIYSHFYNAEEKNSLKSQLNIFLLAYKLIKGYNNNILAHISSSGGFLQGVELDMVRIGILLYGYKPFKSDILVKPIMQVFAPKIADRRVNIGENLLYGENKQENTKKVSLVRYGYADGLARKKSGNMLNNRCMDITAYDFIKGSYAPILDNNADILAKEQGTISYEILTSVSLRAEKIYIR